MPFSERKADTQLTMYASTKKANESMAHSYSYLWKIPTTVFRFYRLWTLGKAGYGIIQICIINN